MTERHALRARVASAPLPMGGSPALIGVGLGCAKVGAIRAALVGRLVTGLITSEATAERLLE